MLIMAVDDEQLILHVLVTFIKEVEPEAEVVSFVNAVDALEYANNHKVDVAFLDIQMHEMSGIDLGKQMKMRNPKTNIIFCTGYDDYAYQAIHDVRATGYVLKPIKLEDIAQEMKYLHVPVERSEWSNDVSKEDIFFRCFGQFELFCKGKPVIFRNTKTKELLAYLVDRRGALCSNRQIEIELWEDDADHRKYLTKIRKDMKDTFEELNIAHILHAPFGSRNIGIFPDKVTCDYYRWLNNDPDGVRAFYGEYMEQYSWAEMTKASIFQTTNKYTDL